MAELELVIATEDERVAGLCREYWARADDGSWVHRVGDLAAKYGLGAREVLPLVRSGCHAFRADLRCKRCDRGTEVSSRNGFQEAYPVSICDSCRQEESAARAEELRRAQERRAILEESRRARLLGELVIEDLREPDLSTLTLLEAVGLLALLRSSLDSDAIPPADYRRPKWMFHYGSRGDLLMRLAGDLLLAHPGNSTEVFTWEGERFTAWYPGRAWTYLRGSGGLPDRHSRAVTTLTRMLTSTEWPLHWRSQWRDTLIHVMTTEALGFFDHELAGYGLEYPFGDGTWDAFQLALEHFALGSVFSLAWRSARDAAAFYQKGGVTRDHASRSALTSFRRTLDRAVASGWEVRPFGQPRDLPPSEVAHVLLVTTARIPDPYGTPIDEIVPPWRESTA